MIINYKIQKYLIYFIAIMWLYIIVKVSIYFSYPDFFWLFYAINWTVIYLYQKYIPYLEIRNDVLIKNTGFKKEIDLNQVVRIEHYLDEIKLVAADKSLMINADRIHPEDYQKLKTYIQEKIQNPS